jgi:hypothetical protein
MTHHRFVTRASGDSVYDNDEELLKDKKLIVLLESIRYCTKNKKDRIRYGQLKYLSNDKLTNLTHGKNTDMGGSFEKYIVEFESTNEPAKRLVERQKIKHKESYIIPNIQAIRNHFSKRNLINLIDESSTSFKAAKTRNYENEKISSALVIGEIPKDKDKEPTVRKHRLYTVSYYYENGKPVFVEADDGREKDPAPFYEVENSMSAFMGTELIRFDKDTTLSPVLITDPWSVYMIKPKNRSILVTEDNLERLLSIGKSMASSDSTMSFGIVIEYKGHITR